MKARTFSPTKLSNSQVKFRASNHQETRYYCDLCHSEVGLAEGKDLPDGRFVHKRHRIPVPVKIETPPPGFWETLKARLNETIFGA